MSYIEINKDEIQGWKRELIDKYGGAEVVEKEYVVDEEEFPELVEYSKNGFLGGATSWVTRQPEDAKPLSESMSDVGTESDRVLMVLHRGANEWSLPGGKRENDETFEETAVREVVEETGIECRIKDLICVREETTVSRSESEERLHTISVFFEAEYEKGTISIQGSELNGAAWFDEYPERMRDEDPNIAEIVG